MTDFTDVTARWKDASGMSLRALAKAVPCDASQLSRILSGKQRPSAQMAAALDHALRAGGEITAAARTAREIGPAPEGQQVARGLARATAASFSGTAGPAPPSAWAAAAASAGILLAWESGPPRVPVTVLTAGQVGLREIEQLEAATDMFRVWDHQRGGGLGRRAATGQLADVAELVARPHPEPLARRLLSVAARMSIIVAHMSADAGLEGDAALYLGLALAAAREAGDSDLGARAANATARAILDAGHPQEAITLLRHARTSLRGLRPPATALLYATEAWASAELGDYGTTAACLDRAEGLAVAAGTVGPAEVAGVAGACYETLAAASAGRSRAQAAAQAGRHITAALDLRDPYYVRSRVLDLAGLARVRLLQDEPDEAMAVAARAVDAAAGLRSQRTVRRLHSLAITAIGQYPSAPAVADFADAVRTRLPL